MNFFNNYETINLIYQVIVFIALPILVVGFVTSVISGLLQSIITVHDEAISYSLKIIAISALLYFIYPTFKEIFVELVKVSLT